MDKNNLIVILLSVLIVIVGFVGGVDLMNGIKSAVNGSLSPLSDRITQIDRSVRSLENKINAQGNTDASASLAAIQKQLTDIQDKIKNQPQGGQPQQPPAEDMNKVYALDAGSSPVMGNKDAPVTITEFADFQCPFCQRFYSAIKDVLGAYPGRVRVIIKNFPLPFHPNARPAAKLALAANEQGQFQGMMEALLSNGADVSDDKVKGYAKDLKLDYNKLMADYKNKDAQWEKQIQEDMQLASRSDVRGTPTFFLNGRKTNARDLNSFKSEIDPILAGKR